MSSMKIIDDFLSTKKFAIAGMSRNPKAFSRMVMKDLSAVGYDITPINPHTEEIAGKKCYQSISDLPTDIDRLLIMTNKAETDDILLEAIKKGMKNIWVQQTSNTNETQKLAKANKFENIVTKQCIFMFANPTSIHKFHRFFNKIFGLLPN